MRSGALPPCAHCTAPCARPDGHCGACARVLGLPSFAAPRPGVRPCADGCGRRATHASGRCRACRARDGHSRVRGRPAARHRVGDRTGTLDQWAAWLGVTRAAIWRARATPARGRAAPVYALDGRTGTLRDWAAWLAAGRVPGAGECAA